MGVMPAARPRDRGSDQTCGLAAAGRTRLAGCADGAQAPAEVEPWALTPRTRGPAPADAPPGPHPPAAARPHPPAAAARPRGSGCPRSAAARPAAGPLPAKQQG